MNVYSITEGDGSHASTSIVQNGNSSNCDPHPNGTTDSRSGLAGHAASLKTNDQAMGMANKGRSAHSRRRSGSATQQPTRAKSPQQQPLQSPHSWSASMEAGWGAENSEEGWKEKWQSSVAT